MCHVGIGDFIPRQGGNLKIVPKIGRNIGDTIKRWADGVEEDQGAWVNINWRREWRNMATATALGDVFACTIVTCRGLPRKILEFNSVRRVCLV